MRPLRPCSARGPHRAKCTDWSGHRYAHYDSSADVSWTDRVEDHHDECECDCCRPDLYEHQETP